MRLILVAPLLPLLACTLENPLFIVESASEAPPASTTEAATTRATDASATTPTTGATDTGMTGTHGTTGTIDTTDATAVTGVTGGTGDTTTGGRESTTEPAGTSEGSSGGSTTSTSDGDDTDMGECLLLKAPFPPDPHVQLIATQQDIATCPDLTIWQGRLIVSEGALKLTSNIGCDNAADPPKYRLGNDFDLLTPDGTVFPCVFVKLLWNKQSCRILSMRITEAITNKLLFAAAFTGPNEIGVKPQPIPGGCSCAGDDGCCAPLPDPGNHALYIDGSEPVGPGELGEVSYKGNPMWLHNIQAWSNEMCSEFAYDWYIEPKLP